jgi:cation diffusion facilitator CzcD-associated flavoprotein CzcO
MSGSTPAPEHHKVLIVGGGTAGIAVAARLRRAGFAASSPKRAHRLRMCTSTTRSSLKKS